MSKLRLAIDTTYMDRRPGKGTAIVIRHTVEELLARTEEFDLTLVHREPIPEDPLYRRCREIVIPRVPLPKFSGFFSELLFFLTTKERFDVYYFSYSRLYPTFWLAPARKIVWAAMDGGPQTSGYRGKAKGKAPWWVRVFLPGVDAFVALSEFGKRGIVSAYRVPPEKVTVVYNGVDDRFWRTANDAALARYGITQPYFLSVSRFDPHKNILRLLEAYASLRERDPSVKESLVFVGGRHMPDYSAEVDAAIHDLGLESAVHIAPYVSDEDMPSVYGCATALVFVSLYEGFGLPVIEAMAAGTPVVASNIDALAEIAGSSAFIIDPYSVDSIRKGMEEVRNPAVRAQLSGAGKERARAFSWKAHGDALSRLFKTVGTRA